MQDEHGKCLRIISVGIIEFVQIVVDLKSFIYKELSEQEQTIAQKVYV